jgi:diadenylate cyclase
VGELLRAIRLRDLVDIGIVAFIFYRVLVTFRGTLAVQMLVGLALLMGARFVSHEVELPSLSFILETFWSFWVLALIVLFQPELRRALAQAGRSRLLARLFGGASAEHRQVVEEVGRAVEALAQKRIGALIALERNGGLTTYAELGVPMDAAVTAELLGSIFQPGSPLHDGAALVQGGRISAAGCFLPLSRNLQLARALGTRHRAALGLSEETDAAVVVVSEENGGISLAVEGRLERGLDGEQLAVRLATLLGAGAAPTGRFRWSGVRRLGVREKA